MNKQKTKDKQKTKKKQNWLVRLYRFFVPKDFKGELQKGMGIGRHPGQSIVNAIFQLGKETRKKVDPEHKIKFGKDKKKK